MNSLRHQQGTSPLARAVHLLLLLGWLLSSQGLAPAFALTAAWLDGMPLPVSKLAHHNFGGGAIAALRVVEATLAANSAHT